MASNLFLDTTDPDGVAIDLSPTGYNLSGEVYSLCDETDVHLRLSTKDGSRSGKTLSGTISIEDARRLYEALGLLLEHHGKS